MIYGNRIFDMFTACEHSVDDIVFVDTIYHTEHGKYVSEANRGEGKDLGIFKIFVYGKEGKIPHFHLKNKEEKEIACICLAEPMYFSHGKHHSKHLSDDELNDLYSYMKAKNKKNPKLTNWQNIVNQWESSNSDKDYEYKGIINRMDIPDYAHLDGERTEESKEDKEKRKEKLGKK